MNVVYATTTTQVMTPDGGRWSIIKGQHWPADDPVVKAAPQHFSADARYGMAYSSPPRELSEPPVEQATAAPGERRAAVRRDSRG